jgi:hypothetical protein
VKDAAGRRRGRRARVGDPRCRVTRFAYAWDVHLRHAWGGALSSARSARASPAWISRHRRARPPPARPPCRDLTAPHDDIHDPAARNDNDDDDDDTNDDDEVYFFDQCLVLAAARAYDTHDAEAMRDTRAHVTNTSYQVIWER